MLEDTWYRESVDGDDDEDDRDSYQEEFGKCQVVVDGYVPSWQEHEVSKLEVNPIGFSRKTPSACKVDKSKLATLKNKANRRSLSASDAMEKTRRRWASSMADSSSARDDEKIEVGAGRTTELWNKQRTVVVEAKRSSLCFAGMDATDSRQTSYKTEAFEYCGSEELEACREPMQELARVLGGIEKDDWPEIFHTLTTVRQLSLHHGNLLVRHLNGIIRHLVHHVDNLRSAVAKNAILSLSDAWKGLGRHADSEMGVVVPVLLKRFGQTSGFLCEVADGALTSMIDHGTRSRMLSVVLGFSRSRNGTIRAKTADIVYRIVRTMVSRDGKAPTEAILAREIGKMLNQCRSFLEDSNAEARKNGRKLVGFLMKENLVSSTQASTYIPSNILSKIRLSLDEERGAIFSDFALSGGQVESHRNTMGNNKLRRSSSSTAPRSMRETPRASKSTRKRMTWTGEDCGDSNDGGSSQKTTSSLDRNQVEEGETRLNSSELAVTLSTVYRRLNSNEWRERQRGVSELVDLVISNVDILCENGKIMTVFDRLNERLQDGNLKVKIFSLESMNRLLFCLDHRVEMVFHSFLVALSKNLASSNSTVVSAAQCVLDSVKAIMKPGNLFPAFCSLAEHGPQQIRVAFLRDISEMIGRDVMGSRTLYGACRYHILPLCSRLLLKQSGGELLVAAKDCLDAIERQIPEISKLLTDLPKGQQKILLDYYRQRRRR